MGRTEENEKFQPLGVCERNKHPGGNAGLHPSQPHPKQGNDGLGYSCINWRLRSSDEINAEIQKLRELKQQMVGSLYPQIVERDLWRLYGERGEAWNRERESSAGQEPK